MICPPGSDTSWAPATGGSPWAGVDGDAGLVPAASLAGKCLGWRPVEKTRLGARRETARAALACAICSSAEPSQHGSRPRIEGLLLKPRGTEEVMMCGMLEGKPGWTRGARLLC